MAVARRRLRFHLISLSTCLSHTSCLLSSCFLSVHLARSVALHAIHSAHDLASASSFFAPHLRKLLTHLCSSSLVCYSSWRFNIIIGWLVPVYPLSVSYMSLLRPRRMWVPDVRRNVCLLPVKCIQYSTSSNSVAYRSSGAASGTYPRMREHLAPGTSHNRRRADSSSNIMRCTFSVYLKADCIRVRVCFRVAVSNASLRHTHT